MDNFCFHLLKRYIAQQISYELVENHDRFQGLVLDLLTEFYVRFLNILTTACLDKTPPTGQLSPAALAQVLTKHGCELDALMEMESKWALLPLIESPQAVNLLKGYLLQGIPSTSSLNAVEPPLPASILEYKEEASFIPRHFPDLPRNATSKQEEQSKVAAVTGVDAQNNNKVLELEKLPIVEAKNVTKEWLSRLPAHITGTITATKKRKSISPPPPPPTVNLLKDSIVTYSVQRDPVTGQQKLQPFKRPRSKPIRRTGVRIHIPPMDTLFAQTEDPASSVTTLQQVAGTMDTPKQMDALPEESVLRIATGEDRKRSTVLRFNVKEIAGKKTGPLFSAFPTSGGGGGGGKKKSSMGKRAAAAATTGTAVAATKTPASAPKLKLHVKPAVLLMEPTEIVEMVKDDDLCQ